MTIGELHAVCYPCIKFRLNAGGEGYALDRENPAIMQAFEDIVITRVDPCIDCHEMLEIIPEMQMTKKKA